MRSSMEKEQDCLSVCLSLGYHIRIKEVLKLELAAGMVLAVMSELGRNIRYYCCLTAGMQRNSLPVLLMIMKIWTLSVMLGMILPYMTFHRKKGRPAKCGKRLLIIEDFSLLTEKLEIITLVFAGYLQLYLVKDVSTHM